MKIFFGLAFVGLEKVSLLMKSGVVLNAALFKKI